MKIYEVWKRGGGKQKMAAEKTQSGAFQDSHTSTHDKEYAYKEEVFELSRDRTAAKKPCERLAF